MENRTRLSRLRRLRAVVQMHKDAKGEPVKLNGAVREFNMSDWDCGTSACALGSYVLTPFGDRHFYFSNGNQPILRGRMVSGFFAGAEHFGITDHESEWLFAPGLYNSDPIPPHNVIRRIDSLIRKYSGEPNT